MSELADVSGLKIWSQVFGVWVRVPLPPPSGRMILKMLIVDRFEDAILGCCIQEELVALMTDYLDAGKQIVVASKVPLSQIRGCSCTNIRMARLARGKTLVLAPCDHMCVND